MPMGFSGTFSLSCPVLTPSVYGVKFCGRIPVRFNGTVSLSSWSYWSWAVVYVCSVYVFGFWLLLHLSLLVPSHQLVIWVSVCPPPLVFCCAGVGRLCWGWFFHVYKVVRLFSYSCSVVCSHYLVVFPDRSWILKVSAHREEVEDPLALYSVNCDNSPT